MADTASAKNTSENSVVDNKPNPANLWTRRLLLICAVIWVWHLFADRLTPYSEHTRMRTYVTPIVPQVSGRVSEVEIEFNQRVSAGELLFKIDPQDYQLALEQAQASFDQATQNIGASSDDIISAEAKLTQAETYFDYAKLKPGATKCYRAKGLFQNLKRPKWRLRFNAPVLMWPGQRPI
jgi:multidrug resistance efflux pump